MDFLGLHWFSETIIEAVGYHSRASRTSFQVWRPGKFGATVECFAVTVLFGFANRFALRSNDDDRLGGISPAGHLQNTVVTIMFPRQLDVENIAVRICANRL